MKGQAIMIDGYTAKRRWLFQPWVGLSQLQALKQKSIIIMIPTLQFNSYELHTVSYIYSLGCVYRVHVSRVMGDVTCA